MVIWCGEKEIVVHFKGGSLMKKLKKESLQEIWNMKNMSVKECMLHISSHPDLKFLLTSAGVFWLIRMSLTITILGNVIYYAIRIFNLVLN